MFTKLIRTISSNDKGKQDISTPSATSHGTTFTPLPPCPPPYRSQRDDPHVHEQWSLIFREKWLNGKDLCSLRVCRSLDNFIVPILEQSAYFRVPKNGQLTFAPRRVIVTSVKAIPPSATHVHIPEIYELINTLPPAITHLSFGPPVAYPVDDFPPNLTHLTFGYSFNQPVNNLPASLTHLTFGAGFNQQLYVMPPHLTHVTFGDRFDQIILRLPPTLIRLTFGYDFNKPVYPLPNLTHLTFGYHFNKPLPHFPLLTHLVLGEHFLHCPTHTLTSPLLSSITFGSPRFEVEEKDVTLLSPTTKLSYVLLELEKKKRNIPNMYPPPPSLFPKFLTEDEWKLNPFCFSTFPVLPTPLNDLSSLTHRTYSLFLFSLTYSFYGFPPDPTINIGIFYYTHTAPTCLTHAFAQLIENFPANFQQPGFPGNFFSDPSKLLLPFVLHFMWHCILPQSSLAFFDCNTISVSIRHVRPVTLTSSLQDYIIYPGESVGLKKVTF